MTPGELRRRWLLVAGSDAESERQAENPSPTRGCRVTLAWCPL